MKQVGLHVLRAVIIQVQLLHQLVATIHVIKFQVVLIKA